MSQRKHLQFVVAAAWLPLATLAQIRTDASLGYAPQTLFGPAYAIPQSIGKLSASNLFHSFQTFNINSGESATFSTASAGIQNVISRVTGGDTSFINGPVALKAASGAPNFYFINPAGITFGAGASIDVPGAFHVSTANYLQFPDGNFYADTSSASTFSSAEPSAFGFLGNSRAAIQIKDSLLNNLSGGISLVASDLSIDKAGLRTGSGDIRVAAIGSGSTAAAMQGALPSASGRLEMNNGSYLYSGATAQSAGGNIVITAGDGSVRGGALVLTDSASARPAGSITAELGSLVIDGRSATDSTGIISRAAQYEAGAGGHVAVTARDTVQILGGGMITSDTYGLGDAGDVTVKAGSLLLDGSGHANVARISSQSGLGGAGNSGSVDVDVADSIVLSNASKISSDTLGKGQGGSISLRAGKDIQVLTDSSVTSSAYAAGNAGVIDISAQNLTIDGSGGKLLTQVSSQANYGGHGHAGSIYITTPGALNVLNGGRVNTSTFSSGNAGEILVTTGKLLLDGRDYQGSTGIFSTAGPSFDKESGVFFHNTGNGGNVNINVAGDAQILRYANVSSDTWSRGRGGNVFFRANSLLIDGMNTPYGAGAGISSEAADYTDKVVGLSGHGGSVVVDVLGQLQISGLGHISTSSFTQGNGGPVTVMAGHLIVGGGGRIKSGSTGSGNAGNIAITAEKVLLARGEIKDIAWIHSDSHGSGDAGTVSVTASNSIELAEGGFVSSDAYSMGHARTVSISAPNIRIGGSGLMFGAAISSDAFASGNGGNVEVSTQSLTIEGGAISSKTIGIGNAGNISINTNHLLLASGNSGQYSWIWSDSDGSGAAGSIDVKATNSIELAEGGFITSDAYSTGHAGSVSVSAQDIRIGGSGLMFGAAISSDTYDVGNAGRVEVNAHNVTIAGGHSQYPTGVVSQSLVGSSGNGGSVTLNASKALKVLAGGVVTSGVAGSGRGGEVHVKAGSLELRGEGSQISAAAKTTSSAQPGNVAVHVDGAMLLASGGSLSIQNDGYSTRPSSVLPSQLSVKAAILSLSDAGAINANATGNVAAGALQINISDRLSLDNSRITTSANSGNGGPIYIESGNVLELNRSQITTSVLGQSGNGGDIHVSARALVLNTGFVQANTAARDAAGGRVAINVQNLLASGNTLFLGGSTPYDFSANIFGFNVIQAAAAAGVSGAIDVAAPVLDISGSLSSLGGSMIDGGNLGRNPCQTSEGSSLSATGRGGVAPSAKGWLHTHVTEPTVSLKQGGVMATTTDFAAKVLTCRNL